MKNGKFELSVNLEYMFQETGDDLADRVIAPASAGFKRAEIFTTGDRDVTDLAKTLTDSGVEIWAVIADPRTILAEKKHPPLRH